jgi:predicted permease
VRRTTFLEPLVRDVRYGARQLRQNPGFTVVAALSLALGVGANTAVFQLLDAVRLRTLPVEKPEELVEVRLPAGTSRSGSFTGGRSNLTNPMWEQIRAHQQAFSGIFAWSSTRFNLARGGEMRFAEGLWVSGDFFRTLGVQPLIGRLLTATEDTRGCSPDAVISHAFWQRELGGDAAVLGRTITLEGKRFNVIGVTPPAFFGVEVGRRFDVVVPICAEPIIMGERSGLDRRAYWWLASMGRLKPDWTVKRAIAQLEAVSPALFEATLPSSYQAEMAKTYLGYKLTAEPAGTGVSSLRAQYENPLWLLMGTAGLVLLIACANLANLMLARATAREREFAIRLALGASRARVIRQLLVEGLLLALVGAALGALLARGLSRSLVAFLETPRRPLFLALAFDWRLLGFTALAAGVTCILFGLAPALSAARTTPGAAAKSAGRGLTASRERFGLRRVLVVSQVALSVVLLAGALLFVRSLRNLTSVNPGFRQSDLIVAELTLPEASYPAARRLPLRRDLIERLRATPGVESIAEVSIVPVSGSGWNESVFVDGQAGPKKGESFFNRVSPEYFKTMGTPILSGRDFGPTETSTSPLVAIVNETFARRFLDGRNPVGTRFRVEAAKGESERAYEIVGFVKDTKYYNLREEFRPTAFLASPQEPRPDNEAQFVIHSRAVTAQVVTAVKGVIADVDPSFDVSFRVFNSQIRDTMIRERLMATLTSFFGFLAVLIAVIGLYGVISYMVARRRNEIGIRMALGAARRDIVRMILREAAVLLAAGLAAGIGLTLLATRAVASILYNLKPNDPSTIAAAAAVLAGVALVASYLPARRASTLEPMRALREE